MRKIASLFPIILLIMTMLPGMAVGQEWRDNRGVFVGLNLGLGEDVNIYTHDDADYFAKIIPSVGYRFNHRWSVGLDVELQAGEYRQFNPTLRLFGEYNFVSRNRFDVFARAQFSYGIGVPADYEYPGLGVSNYMVEYGFALGADFYITRRLAARLTYPFIGLAHGNRAYREDSKACVRGGDFMLDFGVRRLLIGLRYTF